MSIKILLYFSFCKFVQTKQLAYTNYLCILFFLVHYNWFLVLIVDKGKFLLNSIGYKKIYSENIYLKILLNYDSQV